MSLNKWFVIPRPNPSAELRIFCFPYAGGSAVTYMDWVKHLPANIEVVIVQPPGRGPRMFESLFTNMDALITELVQLIPSMLNKPYIFYGHSLGSRVAFELMNQLKKHQLSLPIHFIASGSKGPHLLPIKKAIYQLPENEFIEELKQLSGTPTAVLENKELMDLFIPLLRADFEIADTYSYQGNEKFDCLLTVLGGEEDDITIEQLNSWKKFFNQEKQVNLLPGGHFFIDSHSEIVFKHVNQILQQSVEKLLMSTVLN
jgi:medium-chain acyl-[acyl-carrier-protein] hydrolase